VVYPTHAFVPPLCRSGRIFDSSEEFVRREKHAFSNSPVGGVVPLSFLFTRSKPRNLPTPERQGDRAERWRGEGDWRGQALPRSPFPARRTTTAPTRAESSWRVGKPDRPGYVRARGVRTESRRRTWQYVLQLSASDGAASQNHKHHHWHQHQYL